MQDRIHIGSPADKPWPLTLTEFETSLHQRWPQAHTTIKQAVRSHNDYLAFHLTLDDQDRNAAYFPHEQIVLSDGTPTLWADTIAWFLNLLPDDAEVVCMKETSEGLTPLPRHATTQQITEILNNPNT
jgi:hypothetical protein